MHEAEKWISYFCISLPFVYALARLVPGKPGRADWAVVFICLNFGLNLLFGFWFVTGVFRHFPALFPLVIALRFFSGPVDFQALRLHLGRPLLPGRVWHHLIPGMLLAGYLLTYSFQPAAEQVARVQDLYANGLAEYRGVFAYLAALGAIHELVYAAIALRHVFPVLTVENFKREITVRITGFFLFFAAFLALSTLLGFVLRSFELYLLGVRAGCVLAVSTFVLFHRYPQLFTTLEELGTKKKYQKSRLSGVDVEQTEAAIRELMETEHFYRDDEATVDELARRLDLNKHQLSEVLNNELKVGFWGLLNRYRVAEARELLRQEPDRTILAIAFAVGFNSKSTFNAAFKKQVGMSPSQYREGAVSSSLP